MAGQIAFEVLGNGVPPPAIGLEGHPVLGPGNIEPDPGSVDQSKLVLVGGCWQWGLTKAPVELGFELALERFGVGGCRYRCAQGGGPPSTTSTQTLERAQELSQVDHPPEEGVLGRDQHEAERNHGAEVEQGAGRGGGGDSVDGGPILGVDPVRSVHDDPGPHMG